MEPKHTNRDIDFLRLEQRLLPDFGMVIVSVLETESALTSYWCLAALTITFVILEFEHPLELAK